MARIPEDFIEQVLDRADIVAVIERYVPLKKAGANYQARCPFHNEKTPSFTVSPSKQFYHCFGCGAHGTAITFLMEHAGYGFIDAVRELAGGVGLALPEGAEQPEDDGQRGQMLAVMDAAYRHYRQQLKLDQTAIAYLKQRGLTGESAARFGLGYAPDVWQGLNAAIADYQSPLLAETGLVIAQDGKRYDRFRGRVMFPIRNERGHIIGFGGRVLGAGEPKYLNSPETPLFHKGRELYGLHEHRRAIQQADQVIVVEGYMDVVMLDQHGVDNAVATLGTAITADQAARLLRLATDVVFAFDGDNAGRRAAWRALENSLPQMLDGKRMGFMFLPEGEDPDSYVRQHGKERFMAQCRAARPLSEFLFDELQKQAAPDSAEGRVQLATLARPFIDKLQKAPLLQTALRQRLTDLTGLGGRVGAGRALPPRARAPRRAARTTATTPWHRLLIGVIDNPARHAQLGDLPEADSPETHSPEAQALLNVVSVLREHPEYTRHELFAHLADRPELPLLQAAEAEPLRWGDDYDLEADFQAARASLLRALQRQAVQRLASHKPSELSLADKARLLASLKPRRP